MSRYQKSYRHINSQCEKKTENDFFFPLLEEKESVRERERHALEILGQSKTFVICSNLHLQ